MVAAARANRTEWTSNKRATAPATYRGAGYEGAQTMNGHQMQHIETISNCYVPLFDAIAKNIQLIVTLRWALQIQCRNI
jgi:hypothetical protein